MRRRALCLVLTALATACGGSSSAPPTTPSPTPVPGGSSKWSIGGTITDAITGQGVAGATLAFTNFPSVTTDGGGQWQLTGTGASPGIAVLASTISAPGFHARETRIEWKAGRADVALSLLPERSPFSLDFFRKLVRNAHEEPDELEPIRRWMSNPNFYLNAHNPLTNAKLTTAEVEMIESTIRRVVPQVTGGSLAAGFFDVGTTDRAQRLGWINIEVVYEPEEDYCAQAFVGSNPGLITINYDACRLSWCRESISPNVLAHEVGHAMGLWHVPGGMMVAELDDCYGTTFSQDEQLHSRLAYQRPNGNVDIDRDPVTFHAVTSGSAPHVTCRSRRR